MMLASLFDTEFIEIGKFLTTLSEALHGSTFDDSTDQAMSRLCSEDMKEMMLEWANAFQGAGLR